MPREVWLYVVVPILLILFLYFLFWIIYRRKKDTYYYNYVVDYVYSTLGIVFCSILLCLLLGYSIATVQVLNDTNLLSSYLVIAIILLILPVIPAAFLAYLIKVFVKNLKRKDKLDLALEEGNEEQTDFSFGHQDKNEIPTNDILTHEFDESEFELKKKR